MEIDVLSSSSAIKKALYEEGIRLNNTTDNFNAWLISSAFSRLGKSIFVVTNSLYEAQKYYDKLVNLLDEDQVLFYPADELITSELLISSIEFRLERITTINLMINQKPHIIVTNLNGIIKKQLTREKWEKEAIIINKFSELKRDELVKHLIESGYEREYTVTKLGQFSVRGSIVDIFPINQIKPIRIDYFDDEIEEIKEFDINTQRSTRILEDIEIMPLNEIFYDDEEKDRIISMVHEFQSNRSLSVKEQEMIEHDLVALELRENISLLSKYISFMDNSSILDFISDKQIYFIDETKILQTYQKINQDIEEYALNLGGKAIIELDYFYKLNEVVSNHQISFLNPFSSVDGLSLRVRDANKYYGDVLSFVGYVNKAKNEKRIIVCIREEYRLKGLKEALINNNVSYQLYKEGTKENGLYLCLDRKALGLEFYEENILIYTDEEIFKRIENKVRYRSSYGEGARLKSIADLKVGDYVVHYNHGIGRYLGIETMELSGIKRDYIKIMYAGNDFFYVPLEQIDLVLKYVSNVENPKLNKIDGVLWAKTKEKVKAKVKDISDKLINLYAERLAAEGYAFSEDTPDQVLFDADFPYEETPDQHQAILDVKKDMENKNPMDRLVCGDVGYGKTEIAMRGAFKALYNNKQVAYLAPTTVLVKQQFNSFVERFSKFGANVETLSRLTTPSEQKRILEGIKKGTIDILIGTHRILSKDVVFKDLGLLIVDEEQRFGVEHKERIKEMKVNVDTITLTATPIPRTLQMSMLGIKDLSVINTPPKNRYPVQTYVVERHDTLVKEAIEKELTRKGQVFYLYNSVEDIERMANKIKILNPNARVTFAHGRMNKNDLEDRIEAFVEYQFDVLVCTTIIETGIDIPNANTLIIHDATKLGLSQMYQLRGRVGRSNKIAYAYLMYDEHKLLTEKATQRLEAIRDFTELGSGYKIAMRDLAIRGAGDILGSSQSGFIDSVGIDLYMKILEETIKEKKGISDEKEVDNNVYTDRHIPKTYVSDDGIRIELHKRIDVIECEKDLVALEEEIADRFGKVSPKIRLYMYEKLFNNLLKKNQLSVRKKEEYLLELVYKENAIIDGEKLFLASLPYGRAIKLSNIKNKTIIRIDLTLLDNHWLIESAKFLEKLL